MADDEDERTKRRPQRESVKQGETIDADDRRRDESESMNDTSPDQSVAAVVTIDVVNLPEGSPATSSNVQAAQVKDETKQPSVNEKEGSKQEPSPDGSPTGSNASEAVPMDVLLQLMNQNRKLMETLEAKTLSQHKSTANTEVFGVDPKHGTNNWVKTVTTDSLKINASPNQDTIMNVEAIGEWMEKFKTSTEEAFAGGQILYKYIAERVGELHHAYPITPTRERAFSLDGENVEKTKPTGSEEVAEMRKDLMDGKHENVATSAFCKGINAKIRIAIPEVARIVPSCGEAIDETIQLVMGVHRIYGIKDKMTYLICRDAIREGPREGLATIAAKRWKDLIYLFKSVLKEKSEWM